MDTSRKLDFDLELPADLPGFLSASCAKVSSSLLDSLLRSSRSTDAKTSETPVVDDATQPPPNSSPGEQQQQQRVYKKANKRVNKKVKRES